MDVWMAIAMCLAMSDSRPVLSDRDRFPPAMIAKSNLKFNLGYQDYIKLRLAYEIHNQDYWWEALQETEYLYCCWDWLHAAQEGEGRDEEYWKKSLGRLKGLIGEGNFAAGGMPPPVPIWRFQVMK